MHGGQRVSALIGSPSREMQFVAAMLLTASVVWSYGSGQASAETVADFYRGRTIDYIVGSGAGGGYDLYARTLSRRLGEHIPGKPTVVVKNMAGAGGIRATNFLYNIAPKDGSVIGTVSRSMITAPIVGVTTAKFDPAQLTWIGNITGENSVCVAWSTAPVKTWDDLLKTRLIVGAAGQGTTTYTAPILLKNMFAAKLEIISGYPDGGQIDLAMERGEVQAVCPALSTIRAAHPQWIRDGTVRIIVVMSLRRDPELPDVPAVAEFTDDPRKRQLLKIILGPDLVGRPLLAPPDVPADRVAVLREAFMAAMQDPVFRADAAKIGLSIDPTAGADVQKLVNEIVNAPADLISSAKGFLSKL